MNPIRTALAAALLATALLASGCGDNARQQAKDLPAPAASGTTTSAAAGPWQSAIDSTPAPAPGTAPQANLSEPFRISAAPAGATPRAVVTLILDPACPACRAFDRIAGPVLASYTSDPQVAVDYRVISFLDRAGPDRYSSRAANALYCAWADAALAGKTGAWRAYLERLFEAQPAEGGAGLPDSRLAALGDGQFPGLSECVAGEAHGAQVTANTRAVLADKSFKGTPTVLINGTEFSVSGAEDLRGAIDAAKG
ncbi:DsbA family protein [Gordonia sp. (in: high G+C Gram-positive bacteria)]|uniref:DsbA family protein n=1 Tax=unclassified Gordonia (in: high G+C Gram-positive bacteria) TaxID=2657482 RepID=UPI00260DCC7D|nr:thioredoxin domain-containing protein [Gordonia sp. (in: high G+C Gram-positive bacteria)]